MQTKLLLVGIAALGLVTGCREQNETSSLPAGVTLVETVTAKPGAEVAIPYAKYRLDNGLTVILHEDRSDPIAHVDVTYHVGSAREEVGKSGFAHLFEHMMFQGSTNVGDDQHFKIISEVGGTRNGTTNRDRTNYFQTVPVNHLEKVLWLEADRMGFLLDAVTQEKFEVQRATVKNERGENYDNRPYGLLYERVGEALYPEGHPYSWMTIGYLEDVDRVDVNDLKKFFLRWYGPNNATLTIGGDIATPTTLAWVVKYFGSIPRGPDVAPAEKTPVTLPATRYISMSDNVALPLLQLTFPTVHRFHPDEAPLDVLTNILGSGRTSLLYKNLVKNEIAVRASTNHGCGELACTLTITTQPNPTAGKTLAELEQVVRASVAELETRGVTDDDLERTKMGIVSRIIYDLESVSGKVGRLASYETLINDPSYTTTDIERYENVTKEDVMRVWARYVKDKPSVVMSIVPEGQDDAPAAADTWRRPERKLPEYATVADEDLEYRPATDDFDRSVMPPAGPSPAVRLPSVWRDQLPNGVRVIGARNVETPTTVIRLRIEAGQRDESLDKLGLAAITAAMLNESTQTSTNEEISNRLQKLGSSITFAAGNDRTVASVRSLSKHLDETLGIMAEKLLTPKLDAADFARVRAQTAQRVEQAKKEALTVADVVRQLLLIGKNNPVAYSNIGTSESVPRLTPEDARGFYAARYSPRAASIVAVSNLDQATVMSKLAVLAEWKGPTIAPTPLRPFPTPTTGKIYLVDKPDAAQSEVHVSKRALPYDATGEYFRSSLANFALGGIFSSRINLNLREDKGYTYGAGSYFFGVKEYGVFTAGASVYTNATAASLAEIDKEIRGYAKSGITPKELAFTKSAIGQRKARAYETPSQKANLLSRMLTYDLPDDFVTTQNEILANVTAAELNALAAKHLRMDDMVIVVVGDARAVAPNLSKLGYDIVRVDADANPVDAQDEA